MEITAWEVPINATWQKSNIIIDLAYSEDGLEIVFVQVENLAISNRSAVLPAHVVAHDEQAHREFEFLLRVACINLQEQVDACRRFFALKALRHDLSSSIRRMEMGMLVSLRQVTQRAARLLRAVRPMYKNHLDQQGAQ